MRSPSRSRSRRSRPTTATGAGAAAGLLAAAALTALLWLTSLPLPWAWLLAWSGATFLFYGFDKLQAVRGGWRVPEVVLHLLSVVGGAAGGWLGMLVWRHKIRKPLFPLILALALLSHLLLLRLLD